MRGLGQRAKGKRFVVIQTVANGLTSLSAAQSQRYGSTALQELAWLKVVQVFVKKSFQSIAHCPRMSAKRKVWRYYYH